MAKNSSKSWVGIANDHTFERGVGELNCQETGTCQTVSIWFP